MALFVGLDVSLRTTSICIVEATGKLVWEGKSLSEPVPLLKALAPWRKKITLMGIEACPLSEWLYGALVESKLETVCIETRHTQRFLSSRPNKTDRSDARGIADMCGLVISSQSTLRAGRRSWSEPRLSLARSLWITCYRSS